MSFTRFSRLVVVFFFLSCQYIFPQYVSTLITGSGLAGPDGFALDDSGNLFIANWGAGGTGTTVLKLDPSGNLTTFLTGLNAPDGLTFDPAGNLFISNYNTGVINKVTPGGIISIYAQGFNHPSGLVFDGMGNLYVSNHGNANGTTVSRITPNGEVSDFASGFNGPIGLAFDFPGNLYVSNYSSGIINKVLPDGTVNIFASIPNNPKSYIQYLAFDEDGNLYVPSYGLNKIFRVNPSGEVSVFAGTGVKGGADGRVDSAQFDGPNSIAITPSGDIYISEFNKNRIRKISDSSPLPVNENPSGIPARPWLSQNYPNPFNPITSVTYSIPSPVFVRIRLFDMLGNELMTLVHGYRHSGNYSFQVNCSELTSGTYILAMTAGDFTTFKKIVFLK